MTKTVTSVDKHVGNRMRMRRLTLKMSQEKLGDALGVTFQQIQKYEKGNSRIGAGRLYQISEILQVPLSFLFDGIPSEQVAARQPDEISAVTRTSEFLATPEGVALIRAFASISNGKLRQSIIHIVEQISVDQTASAPDQPDVNARPDGSEPDQTPSDQTIGARGVSIR